MLTDFIDTEILFVLIGGLSFLLLIFYLDRYFTRRRSFVINAEYLARIQSVASNSRVHRMGLQSRANRQPLDARFAEMTSRPQVELATPGFFSRRRVISDQLGRIVATHYEEFVVADHYSGERMLPAARHPLLLPS